MISVLYINLIVFAIIGILVFLGYKRIINFYTLMGSACILGGIAFTFVAVFTWKSILPMGISFAFGSIIWYGFGIGLISLPIIRRRKIVYLMKYGQRVKTKVLGTEMNVMITVNYRHPYYIKSIGTNPFTGEQMTFKSDNVWDNPDRLVPDKVDVLIDPKKPKRYYMDISFLDKAIEEAAK